MAECRRVRARRGRFNLQAHLGESPVDMGFHAELRDVTASAHYFLHGARIDVDAADYYHVVGAAEDAAFKREFLAATHAAYRGGPAHDIAGAVAQQWGPGAAQVREHQLTTASGTDSFE